MINEAKLQILKGTIIMIISSGKPRDKTNEKDLKASNVNKYLNTDQIKSKIFRITGHEADRVKTFVAEQNYCCHFWI